jgi:hypothetical protein
MIKLIKKVNPTRNRESFELGIFMPSTGCLAAQKIIITWLGFLFSEV